MAQVAIFKQIFDKVRNNLNYHWFYSELKRHNVSHYIYYLATENIHLVLENDNTVLIKGQGKVVNVRFSKNKMPYRSHIKRIQIRRVIILRIQEKSCYSRGFPMDYKYPRKQKVLLYL